MKNQTQQIPRSYRDIESLNQISLLTDTINMLELKMETALQMKAKLEQEYGR